MKKILIIGTGGLAREFTSWCSNHFDIIGYSSINRSEHSQFNLPGKLYTDDINPQLIGTDLVFLAIASPPTKERIYKKFLNAGFRFPSLMHPSSTVSNLANVGEGVIVSPNCVISPNVTLGKLVTVNFCCGIGHDTTIGDFTQINPGAQLGGFSKIGSRVLIGSGSTILQGISIGADATVGSGSVVFGKVSKGVTVMGNPAKRMSLFEK